MFIDSPYCLYAEMAIAIEAYGDVVITIAFCVGHSALLVSTNRAMRRPLERGTGNRTGSTFFMCLGVGVKSPWKIITNLAAQREPGRTERMNRSHRQPPDGADQ